MNVSLSFVFGWVYFVCWSLSFYPQVLLNFRRKSAKGLSTDLVVYNLIGFFGYSVYNLSLYYSSSIREQYKLKHKYYPLVQVNDVFFGLHGFVLTIITAVQIVKYDRIESLLKLSKFGIGFVVFSAVLILYSFIKSLMESKWIGILSWLSYIKLATTIIKYMPQAYINYKSKTTKGWSIYNTMLDSTGSIFSLSQLYLDSESGAGINQVIKGNFVKFGLGFVSLLYDIVFFVQHFFIYNNNSVDEDEFKKTFLDAFSLGESKANNAGEFAIGEEEELDYIEMDASNSTNNKKETFYKNNQYNRLT